MSKLALKVIAENKAKHARGEDARVLDLGNCGLTELPDLSGMDWLETLIVSNEWWDITKGKYNKSQNKGPKNKIVNPPNYLYPINLKKLVLSGTHDEKWAIMDCRFIEYLTELKYLDLSNNLIKNSYFLRNLTDLENLSLWNNKIKDGKYIENLTNLKTLNINSNLINNVHFLQNTNRLSHLDLSNNNIKNWQNLELLTSLKVLNLWDNHISDGQFLENLTNLTYLDLSYNEIHEAHFLKNLINLEGLDLNYNKINNVKFLENLVNIKSVDLRNNKVSDLSPLLPFVKKGINIILGNYNSNGINLYKNPLTHPPLEIVSQGNDAILRYFEDLEKQGTDQIYEAKLLLIGEGSAGKTTLCRKLFDPNAPLPQEKDRTKGIDIHPLHFDIPAKSGKQFRLNIWDFAGQGKYQSAHSFFYTHRSLYVLVDDTRTLSENDAYRTLYNNWLQTTELFGGNSPVLVLHNEKEGCARTGFSLGSFQDRFPFVHGELFRINLGGGETDKIEDLRKQIERRALALPHIGDTVPKTWVKVREALEVEKKDHPYISVERYRELCAAAGIADPERQSDLSHYFHDLGVFLHFQDNPLLKRDVFLQNTWVTDAVYKILDDAQIAEVQRGRFSKNDLNRLWQESTYRERRDELLALMLQFELCYQVQDSDTYICPQLLPGDVPAYSLGQGFPLQLKYEYGFMPKGLLYRLMVRLHRHIAQGQTAVWNAGVVLERAGSMAEITESLDRRTISVRATGLRAKELVTIINEELERLHAPFGERLKVEVKIPCNCRICHKSEKPHFYDKTDLDKRSERGKNSIECSESYDDVPVRELLEGVFVKDVNNIEIISSQIGIIKELFQSGQTEEALTSLARLGQPDVPALQARFSNAHQQFQRGTITHSEYEKILNQVVSAGLEMIKRLMKE